jgi:hypothetical protein
VFPIRSRNTWAPFASSVGPRLLKAAMITRAVGAKAGSFATATASSDRAAARRSRIGSATLRAAKHIGTSKPHPVKPAKDTAPPLGVRPITYSCQYAG